MKIAVVGSINLDMTLCAPRIPLKGETLMGTDLSYSPGGKGANQAVAMSRLGADVWMFGCVGNDDHGRQVVENLKNNDVHTEFIKTLADTPTGLAVITVGEQDNTIIVIPGANARADMAYVQEICPRLQGFDMVVLQQEIPLDAVEYVIRFCAGNGIPVSLNPAPAAKVSPEIVEAVTYLTPNEHEVKLIFGNDVQWEDMLRRYPEKLIITQGSRGVSTVLKDGTLLQVPCAKVSVVDTTGAGDTFQAAFAVRVTAGDSLEQALRFANTAAGLSTEKLGAQSAMPSEQQVLERLK